MSTTLFDILRRHAIERPDATAFVFLHEDGTRQHLTYRRLQQRACAIAASLAQTHAVGDRVVLMFQPGLHFIEAFMACFAAGLVAVPMQPLQNRRVLPRLLSMMNDAGSRTLLSDRASLGALHRLVPDVEAQLPGLAWICSDTIADTGTVDFQRPVGDADTLAFLQYTSGSTGTPKGVMVSHANLLSNERAIQQAFDHDPATTRVVGWLPFYHDMGLIGNVFQPLYLGAPCLLMAPMTFLSAPARWLQAISEWRATTSGAPNFAYQLCVDRIADADLDGLDLSSWTLAFNGAEPVKAAVINAFAQRFARCGFRREAFYPCYGMAETTLFITGGAVAADTVHLEVDAEALTRRVVQPAVEASKTVVGCGFPRGEHEVEVVDPATFAVLPDGQVGELWCRGPSIAAGYWGQPELTAATFGAHTADGRGPFLRTGDLGFRRGDQLYVNGRLKDIIIVRGRNHYPDDIEGAVLGSGDVFRPHGAAAFVVGHEDDSQLVVVAEVDRHRLASLASHDLQKVQARARKHVSDMHGLRLHELVLIKPATLPKTSSGKVRRRHCRELYLAGALERAAAAPAHAAAPVAHEVVS